MWQEDGFLQEGATDVKLGMKKLALLIKTAVDQYQSLSKEELLKQPAPGKWSKQQILGHLIDSAINNLKRFTDAQITVPPYIICSYQQDGLMEVNYYQDLPVQHLLTLWQSLNQQIIFVAERIPENQLSIPVNPQYEKTGTQTLGWLICDYVAHMEHHLKAISFIS